MAKSKEKSDSKRVSGSIKELGKKMGLEYGESLALLKFLEKRGIAKDEGIRPSETRGKGSRIYSLPKGSITLELV